MISDKVLERIANDNINKGMTVTGVQKKMSVHLSKDDKYRLTIVGYPTGYILKPQSDDYVNLPEAEYLNMKMAESIGINTVPKVSSSGTVLKCKLQLYYSFSIFSITFSLKSFL